jgi:hypothetical protein
MKSPLERKKSDNAIRPIETELEMLCDALTPIGVNDSSSRRTARPPPGTPEALDAAFDQIVGRLIPDLQRHLDTLVGKNFGPDANIQLSKAINALLIRLGCVLECPRCQAPAKLRYTVYDRHNGPQFKYEHTPQKRCGGTRAFGPMKLVPARRYPEKNS